MELRQMWESADRVGFVIKRMRCLCEADFILLNRGFDQTRGQNTEIFEGGLEDWVSFVKCI